MAVSAVGAKSLQKVWEGPCWEGMDPKDVVGLRTTASIWNVPNKCGPYDELFFFFLKEPVAIKDKGELWALLPSGDDQRMCHVWFAHDGRRECLSRIVTS